MKRMMLRTTLFLTATLVTVSVFASTATDKKTLFAANDQYKTITHKVHSDNCEQRRKEILNRCLYKHKLSKNVCYNQDSDNERVCTDLRKKAAESRKQQ